MMQKMTGIVLHVLKYNDTSNIVDIYTEQVGRASFLVKIPRSRKSNVRSVLFQPLAFVEIEADVRANSNLHRIQEAKSLLPFRSLPYNPYKSSIAMFLAEFYIGLCGRKKPMFRFSPICAIQSCGWMNVRTSRLPIFIWFF